MVVTNRLPSRGRTVFYDSPTACVASTWAVRKRRLCPRGVPDAYETLIADAIDGDATLFMRADEVEVIEMPLGDQTAIARGVQELVRALAENRPSVSPGRAGLTVVEVIIGILESQQRGHTPVPIPVPR